jgi:hypothetical protein
MTIVGLERMTNGDLNLLVFDPMFHDAPSITKLVGSSFRAKSAESALKPYRRGNKYLRKYREFEVLRYDSVHDIDPSTLVLVTPMLTKMSID